MRHDAAQRLDATRPWARVCALPIDAGLLRGALRVDDALVLAAEVRVSLRARAALAHRHVVVVGEAVGVGAARVGHARVRHGLGLGFWVEQA